MCQNDEVQGRGLTVRTWKPTLNRPRDLPYLTVPQRPGLHGEKRNRHQERMLCVETSDTVPRHVPCEATINTYVATTASAASRDVQRKRTKRGCGCLCAQPSAQPVRILADIRNITNTRPGSHVTSGDVSSIVKRNSGSFDSNVTSNANQNTIGALRNC